MDFVTSDSVVFSRKERFHTMTYLSAAAQRLGHRNLRRSRSFLRFLFEVFVAQCIPSHTVSKAPSLSLSEANTTFMICFTRYFDLGSPIFGPKSSRLVTQVRVHVW